MSLKVFHIVFITVSSLLCLLVGLWAVDAYRADGAASWLALAATAFVGGGALVVYGSRFMQKMRKLAVAALVAGPLAVPTDVLACTVCLGNTQSSLRDGMNAGILALLGIALFMIVSFAAFFIYLWRRSRTIDSSDHQGEPAHA